MTKKNAVIILVYKLCMAEYTGEYCYHIDVQACMVEYTGEYCIILVYKLVWLSILENTVSYWCTSLYG